MCEDYSVDRDRLCLSHRSDWRYRYGFGSDRRRERFLAVESQGSLVEQSSLEHDATQHLALALNFKAASYGECCELRRGNSHEDPQNC